MRVVLINMVKYFHFHIDENEYTFDAPLQSQRCKCKTRDGSQCKRNVIFGLPCCHSHIVNKYRVKVMDSLKKEAGKGIFAWDMSKGDDAIVFRKQEFVCPYAGELINRNDLIARYGEYGKYTAPYAIKMDARNLYEDAALYRGVGGLVNHDRKNANVEFLTVRLPIYDSKRTTKIVGHEIRTCLYAIKDIMNHSELYADYGKTYRLQEKGVMSSTNNRKKHV